MAGEGEIIIIAIESDLHQLLYRYYVVITTEKWKILASPPADRAEKGIDA